MKLFEDKIRNDNSIAKLGENVYMFYDTNSQPKIENLRNLLNDWFDNYPEEYKNDLLNNFKNNFYDFFYELFIHELFYKLGYTLIPHPLLPNTEKKPDFLAIKENEKFYIEATTVSYLSDIEQKKENFRDKFVEELNNINSPYFWIVLKNINFKSDNFPKIKFLKSNIENSIAKINYENFSNDRNNLFSQEEIKIEDQNISIVLSLVKKSNNAINNKSNRPIGIQFQDITIKDASEDSEKIFKNLKQKASRYGELDLPLLVCLNLDFRYNIKYDVDFAFYNKNFIYSINPKLTKLSATLINNVSLGNIFNSQQHRIIINPHSLNKISIENLQLTYELNEKVINKKSIEEVLNLN